VNKIQILLDSSAILALLYQEPGADRVDAERKHAAIGTVNWAEVATTLFEDGMQDDMVRNTLIGLNLTIVPFTDLMAYEAGRLRPLTRAIGLSLGDRACLATARVLDIPVLTADRIWLQAAVGVQVECIR
jgi:PIN domain nuclease of toxin-antitoxin system